MCSICRNPKCIYKFGKDKWKLEDDEVIITLPETDSTLLEAVRAHEALMLDIVTGIIGIPERMLKGKK